VLKPLAGLIVDKGAMPLLGGLDCRRTMRDGFRFEIAETENPSHHDAARYQPKDEWIIKARV